jgi:uncharacterized protein
MIVCIDTNVLLQAAKEGHPYSAIIAAWFQRRFLWAVSNDILTEYEEIIAQRSGQERWRQFSRVLDIAEARGDLMVNAQPSFQFHVISDDPDDNKFTDCAITAGADFVITEDKYFAPLSEAGYKCLPITPDEFIARYIIGVSRA